MVGTVSTLARAETEAYDRLSWNPAPEIMEIGEIREQRNSPR